MRLHNKRTPKEYERCYVNLTLRKNSSISQNSPDNLLRSVQLTPTILSHILNQLQNKKIPAIDVACFQKDDPPNDLVVTLSVPYFPDHPLTTLEERFQ